MTNAEFTHFCTAIANSFANRASALQFKVDRLDRDEYSKRLHLEHRIELLTDQMEAWASAPKWFTG